ncbi:Rv1733c family protein [Streptomyces virginiae]|uniref:Rv1733c family protein n=1 Tax=Streptomyces virginiae TaxID=1961 RepID=UPI0034535D99
MHHRTTGTGANPLRREADRTRTRLHAAFALACLVAVICGVLVGRTAWTSAARAAEEAARHRHLVTATTAGETTYRADSRPSSTPETVATSTWRYPSHRVHTGTVPVPAGTRDGDTVRLWVDDGGNAVPVPPGTAEVALNAIGVGAGVLAGAVLAAGALVFVRLRAVDAQCANAWETEWDQVEPLWSGRLRPGQGAGDD